MNEQEALCTEIGQLLNQAGIPFMIVGSIASIAYSQPRFTNDVDIVIDPTATQLDQWVASLGAGYYSSVDMAREALQQRSMFNVIELKTGIKADLIIRKHRPFGVEEFRRRRLGEVGGNVLPLAAAEDVILAKLEWNRLTPSERQIRDALGVAIAQWPTLDLVYLRKWAPDLGVADDLEDLLRSAQSLQPPSE